MDLMYIIQRQCLYLSFEKGHACRMTAKLMNIRDRQQTKPGALEICSEIVTSLTAIPNFFFNLDPSYKIELELYFEL